MSLQGQSVVLRNLAAAIEAIKKRTAQGLYEAAEVIRTDSVEDTPVDEGTLAGSAKTTMNDTFGVPSAIVSYSVDYAVYVHENLTARHKVGKAKFLEGSVTKNSSRVLGIIQDTAKV